MEELNFKSKRSLVNGRGTFPDVSPSQILEGKLLLDEKRIT